MNVNGINITSVFSGSVTTFPTLYNCCSAPNVISIPPPSIWLGQSGPFAYTYIFSSPVNNLILKVNGTDAGEIFNLVVSNGNPSINLLSGCGFSVSGNQLICTSFTPPLGSGCRVSITSMIPYTTLTIYSNGGGNGSLICLESNSI